MSAMVFCERPTGRGDARPGCWDTPGGIAAAARSGLFAVGRV